MAEKGSGQGAECNIRVVTDQNRRDLGGTDRSTDACSGPAPAARCHDFRDPSAILTNEQSERGTGRSTADGRVIRVRRTDLPADSNGAPRPAGEGGGRPSTSSAGPTASTVIWCSRATPTTCCRDRWPAYRSADYDTRQRMRLEHAAATRSQLAADMVVAAEAAGTDLTAPQRAAAATNLSTG